MQEEGVSVIFLESICTDPDILSRNMRLKLSGPDYAGKDPESSLADFQERVRNYEAAYETISEQEEDIGLQYCKLINVGKKAFFLANIR